LFFEGVNVDLTAVASAPVKLGDETPLWERDAFDRKPYADFLTHYLNERTKPNGGSEFRPFCMALDADWGAGKTYFVRNWSAQLKREDKHPTFVFDAWEFDSTAEPTIAFMSAFKEALDAEIAKLPLADQLQDRARKALQEGVKALGAAVIPMTKSVLRGAINKALPGMLEDLVKSMDRDGISLEEIDIEKLSADGMSGAKAAIDKYFEVALKQPMDRKKLLGVFRMHIENTLELLRQEGGKELPFFVFIDELDRCRPTFAVSLMEELKHIFNVPGMCFVVSTNIPQLSHAVGAIYGSRFDGRNYLQRFFDSEWSLPAPSALAYCTQLVDEFPLLKGPSIQHCLPMNLGFTDPKRIPGPSESIEWVAAAFKLDLRTVKKVAEMIHSCISSLSDDKNIYLLWLAILAASRIRSRELYSKLTDQRASSADFLNLWKSVAIDDVARKYSIPGGRHAYGSQPDERQVSLFDVARVFFERSAQSVFDISSAMAVSKVNTFDYPNSLGHVFASEAHNQPNYGKFVPVLFAKYGNLMKHAGHIHPD
jgi:hypothetical protein